MKSMQMFYEHKNYIRNHMKETNLYKTIKNVTVFLACLIWLGALSWAKYISEHLLFAIPSEMDPGRVFVLKVLPTGEIVDPYIQLTTARWNSILTVSPNNKFLLAGADGTISRYRIENNGELVSLGANTTNTTNIPAAITPNNELVFVGLGNAIFEVFRLTLAGELVDTYQRLTVGEYINPRGNPILDSYPTGYSLQAYHLDYDALTTYRTTIIDNVAGNYAKIVYTPDGSIGLMKGYLPLTVDLRVLKIAPDETVSTTGQYWDFGFTATDVAITPDGRFGLLAIDTSIIVLSIDTANGIVTDTGKRFSFPGLPPTYQSVPLFIRITADGTMLVADYEVVGQRDVIGTAWITYEGDLIWTGYTFPFSATYISGLDAVIDIELVPIYVTDVDSPQWQLYE